MSAPSAPSATAPSSSLSSSARRALRAAAHHLDPVVMMGQHGLTPAVLHEIDLALTAHALIKVRAGSDERETRDGYLTEICEKLSCESVQHLGKLFVLWRNADGAGNANRSAEHDAAAVKASHDPKAATERGPRSKLPSERAAERAGAANAPAARAGGYNSARAGGFNSGRGAPPSGGRGAPAGGRGDAASGPRWRYGETPPDAPRREGWAPKDRRGAARFGEGVDDSRRRDSAPSYGAPRPRPTGGYAGGAGASSSGGGAGGSGSGYRASGNFGDNRGAGGGAGYGGRSNYGGQGGQDSQGSGAPRARWGERREPSQGGGGYAGGGNSGGGGYDRSAPTAAPRSSFSRGNDAGSADRAPRTGGWGNRDGVTGKPSGFSRGGAGGAGGGAPAPRARRRFG
jgi:RNA-binding protein